MPGIFGIIRKKRSSIDSRGLLDKMSEALMHMEWYTKELVSSDEYGFGSISIKNNFRPVHLEYGNKTYIVLVDGYIYKINGNQISNLIHPSETVARELLNLLAPMDPNCYVQVEGNYNIVVYNIEAAVLC